MRRAEGFTLAELIMVIVILGILAAFVGPVLFNALRAFQRVQSGAETQAKMRYAVERMAREMREVRRQATDAAFLDVTSMTATGMSFFKTDGTEVSISLAGDQIDLAYNATLSGMLTDQVGAFSLAYFQQNATTIAATAASLAYVQISLTLSEGASSYPARVRVDVKNPQ